MDYHGRIMSIAGRQDGSESAHHSQYSRGHRDARHAAAAIALEAQDEIEHLHAKVAALKKALDPHTIRYQPSQSVTFDPQ